MHQAHYSQWRQEWMPHKKFLFDMESPLKFNRIMPMKLLHIETLNQNIWNVLDCLSDTAVSISHESRVMTPKVESVIHCFWSFSKN